MQKLIQPLNHMRLTASYKNASYKQRYGCVHYGVDCADAAAPFDRTVWSMGWGTVLDSGWDSVLGNYVVLRYPEAFHRTGKRCTDLIVRMFHFQEVYVTAGQPVTKDTKLGEYGGSGFGQLNHWAKHLHLEVDKDTEYTHYTPTLSGSSSKFIGRGRGATDKTMGDPLEWMHCKTDAPDYQTYTTDGTVYIDAKDKTAERITAGEMQAKPMGIN